MAKNGGILPRHFDRNLRAKETNQKRKRIVKTPKKKGRKRFFLYKRAERGEVCFCCRLTSLFYTLLYNLVVMETKPNILGPLQSDIRKHFGIKK